MPKTNLVRVDAVTLNYTHAIDVKQFADYAAFIEVNYCGQLAGVVLRAGKLSASQPNKNDNMMTKMTQAAKLGVADLLGAKWCYSQLVFHETLKATLADAANQKLMTAAKIALVESDEFEIGDILGVDGDDVVANLDEHGEVKAAISDVAVIKLNSIPRDIHVPQTLAEIVDFPLVNIWTKGDDYECFIGYQLAVSDDWRLVANLDEFGCLGSVVLVANDEISEMLPGDARSTALHRLAKMRLHEGKFDPYGVWRQLPFIDKLVLEGKQLPLQDGQVIAFQLKAQEKKRLFKQEEASAGQWLEAKIQKYDGTTLDVAVINDDLSLEPDSGTLAEIAVLRLSGVDEIQLAAQLTDKK